MHLVYFDESGQPGTNLNDKSQPTFVLAAMVVPETARLPLEKDLQAAVQDEGGINLIAPLIFPGNEALQDTLDCLISQQQKERPGT